MSRVKRRRTENDEPFFDTQSAHSSRAGRSASDKGNKSEDVNTEDDPVGPGSKFEFVDRPEPGTAKPREGEEGDSEDEDSDGGEGGTKMTLRMTGLVRWWSRIPPSRGKESLKDISLSPPSSSNVPPLAKSWLGASSGEAGRACSRGLEYRTTPRRFRNTTPLLMKVRRRRRHIRIWWGGAGRFRLRE